MTLTCAPLLVAVSIAAGTATAPPTGTVGLIEIRIGAVLASNSSQEFDPRLVAMRRQFRTLFPYSSYRLVKEERKSVVPGARAGFEIPGGRYLLVTPRALDGERVSMRVMLIDGTRPLVDTALTLRNHAMFLVGGPRHQGGVLIISIGAETQPLSGEGLPVEKMPAATQ